jgi:hypothetical protein
MLRSDGPVRFARTERHVLARRSGVHHEAVPTLAERLRRLDRRSETWSARGSGRYVLPLLGLVVLVGLDLGTHFWWDLLVLAILIPWNEWVYGRRRRRRLNDMRGDS